MWPDLLCHPALESITRYITLALPWCYIEARIYCVSHHMGRSVMSSSIWLRHQICYSSYSMMLYRGQGYSVSLCHTSLRLMLDIGLRYSLSPTMWPDLLCHSALDCITKYVTQALEWCYIEARGTLCLLPYGQIYFVIQHLTLSLEMLL
jgi:hypothetical protein